MPDSKPFDLSGRVALLTGGNGGLGRSMALGFGRAGASVAIFGRNEAKNAAVLAELRAVGVPAAAFRVNMANDSERDAAFAQVERTLGPVHVLVNNAGIGVFKPALEETREGWEETLDINLTSMFLMSKTAALSMLKRKGGKIINIASMYSLFGSGVVPAYSSSKGAVVQLTKSLAIEFAPHHIQVNAIVPGFFDTEMTAPIKSMPLYGEVARRTPAGRWGHPDECAGAAVFLAAPASDFVTGTTLVVDGGYSIY
ncbi:MAG TPA: SDR family oxidoreductase [Candidatus Acidoferrum sp.]|nr:SDR family oxidoreductase [Candidatus Acidoferrum sp.]